MRTKEEVREMIEAATLRMRTYPLSGQRDVTEELTKMDAIIRTLEWVAGDVDILDHGVDFCRKKWVNDPVGLKEALRSGFERSLDEVFADEGELKKMMASFAKAAV